jgi:hypothetical protein
MAVRGDSPIVIQWCAEHTDFDMTQTYLERGKVDVRRIGEPLPPLPPEVFDGLPPVPPEKRSKRPTGLDLGWDLIQTSASKLAKTPGYFAIPTGIEGESRRGRIGSGYALFWRGERGSRV